MNLRKAQVKPLVWYLMLVQALSMSAAPLMVMVGGLIGKQLHPQPGFATLPVALMIIGTAASALPAAKLAYRWGRRLLFLIAHCLGISASVLAAYAVVTADFWLFCLASLGFGVVIAVVHQFRFVAMDSVDDADKPVVAARLLLAGLVSAFLGPELTSLSVFWPQSGFAAAFIGLAGLYGISFLLLFFTLPRLNVSAVAEASDARSYTELFQQPALWLAIAAAAGGYGVMAYVMTATPLSMTVLFDHDVSEAKWVIQSHIAAMFLPSLISGQLVRWLGVWRMVFLGGVIYAATIMVAWWDQSLIHYWFGLVMLGLGWNLLFVAGTALLPRCYLPHEASHVQGINDMLVFTFQAIGALASGAVLLLLGWHGLLLSSLPVLILLAMLLWRIPASSLRD